MPYILLALNFVSRSDCICTLSARLARRRAERFGLQVLRVPIALPVYTVAQVWHPRAQDDAGHGWFRKLVARVALR